MQYLSLRNSTQRLCLVLAVLVTAIPLLFLIYRNITIRFVADPRFVVDRETLLAMHRGMPDSPRLNLKLAELFLADAASSEESARMAQKHALDAASRSLWDYRAAYTLGTVLELNGNVPAAEAALRTAVRLSPSYKRSVWALGNLLLRQGRTDEAIQFLRNAARIDDTLYLSLYDQLRFLAPGDPSIAARLTDDNPGARLALANYLAAQSEADQAIQLFRTVDYQARRRSPQTVQLMNALIDAGRIATARELWTELQPSPPGSQPTGLWNGGFELHIPADSPVQRDDSQHPELAALFNWNFRSSQYARLAIDVTSSGSGERALRLTLLGRDTTTLRDEVRQLIALRPGESYRVEFAFRTSDLKSPLGPRVAVISTSTIVAQSEPIPAGTSDAWQRARFDFTAPLDADRKFISIIRQPAYSYDDPTSGVVWFDDISLAELTTAPANGAGQ